MLHDQYIATGHTMSFQWMSIPLKSDTHVKSVRFSWTESGLQSVPSE